jgi:hypothetical protein
MLRLLYHQDICHLPVPSDQWANKILKYARVMLSQEQESILKQRKFVDVRIVVGPCSDGRRYTCYMRLLTSGSNVNPYFSYCEGIDQRTTDDIRGQSRNSVFEKYIDIDFSLPRKK